MILHCSMIVTWYSILYYSIVCHITLYYSILYYICLDEAQRAQRVPRHRELLRALGQVHLRAAVHVLRYYYTIEHNRTE